MGAAGIDKRQGAAAAAPGMGAGGFGEAAGVLALPLPVPVERTALGQPVHLADRRGRHIARRGVPKIRSTLIRNPSAMPRRTARRTSSTPCPRLAAARTRSDPDWAPTIRLSFAQYRRIRRSASTVTCSGRSSLGKEPKKTRPPGPISSAPAASSSRVQVGARRRGRGASRTCRCNRARGKEWRSPGRDRARHRVHPRAGAANLPRRWGRAGRVVALRSPTRGTGHTPDPRERLADPAGRQPSTP